MSIASEIARLEDAKAALYQKMEEAGYALSPTDKLSAMVRQLDLTGGGGAMPIGAVIYYAGLTAPDNYLACDGTVYAIADYPALASFFEANYGSKNHWGGDGTTTFAVPDWQGEFFRAAGANSREGQGGGGSVGEHQSATSMPMIGGNYGVNNEYVGYMYTDVSNSRFFIRNVDSNTKSSENPTGNAIALTVPWHNKGESSGYVTSRPTNTSLLVCIRAV